MIFSYIKTKSLSHLKLEANDLEEEEILGFLLLLLLYFLQNLSFVVTWRLKPKWVLLKKPQTNLKRKLERERGWKFVYLEGENNEFKGNKKIAWSWLQKLIGFELTSKCKMFTINLILALVFALFLLRGLKILTFEKLGFMIFLYWDFDLGWFYWC